MPTTLLGRILSSIIYWGIALSVRYGGRVFWGLRVAGREHVPAAGPLIVAVTHESVLDPLLAGAATSRRLRFLARNTLFGPRGEIKQHGRVLLFVGAVPIERDGGGARDTIRAARKLLSEGQAVLIFPEGTRSRDGNVQRFRRGVGLIARAAKCPVLPISIDGSRLLWQKGHRFPRFVGGPVRVTIGAPVTYDKTTSAEDIATELRGMILGLRGTREDEPAGDGAGVHESAGGSSSE